MWTRAALVLGGATCGLASVLSLRPSVACSAGAKPPPQAVISPEQRGTRYIYFVRHGKYDMDDKRNSFEGRHLIGIGREQAQFVAERLKDEPVQFDSLTSSTMTRARETAEIIQRHFAAADTEIPLKQVSLIAECKPPCRKRHIFGSKWADPATGWPPKSLECQAKLEMAARMFFQPSPDARDRHDIVVCHANVIRWFVTQALKVTGEAWLEMSHYNSGLTVIAIRSSSSAPQEPRVSLLTYNDASHIPFDLRTFN